MPRLGLQVGKQLIGNGRAYVFPAGRNLPDRPYELLGSARLRDITRSARLDRADRVLLFRIHAQDEDLDFRFLPLDELQSIEPAQARHGTSTRRSATSSRICLRPSRKIAWSSAMSTRVINSPQ